MKCRENSRMLLFSALAMVLLAANSYGANSGVWQGIDRGLTELNRSLEESNGQKEEKESRRQQFELQQQRLELERMRTETEIEKQRAEIERMKLQNERLRGQIAHDKGSMLDFEKSRKWIQYTITPPPETHPIYCDPTSFTLQGSYISVREQVAFMSNPKNTAFIWRTLTLDRDRNRYSHSKIIELDNDGTTRQRVEATPWRDAPPSLIRRVSDFCQPPKTREVER